jgi:hypothetical protein
VTTLPKTKPGIARTNRGKYHTYTIDGQKTPGVTTILGQVVAKPALVSWAPRLVAEYVADKDPSWLEDLRAEGRDALVDHLKGVPDRAKKAAGARGTDVHALAERVIAGEELEETAELEPLWGHIESCVHFLDDWKISPVLVEGVIGSRLHRYCGTVDLVALLPDGRRVLMDYKTGASGIWPETALQLAAYRHAEAYVDNDGGEARLDGLNIEAAYAVHLRGDGYEVVTIDTEPAWEAFQHIAAAYHLGVGARDGGWSSWLGPVS